MRLFKKLVQTIIGSAGLSWEDITVNPEMNEMYPPRPTGARAVPVWNLSSQGGAVRQGARTPALAHPGHRRQQSIH